MRGGTQRTGPRKSYLPPLPDLPPNTAAKISMILMAASLLFNDSFCERTFATRPIGSVTFLSRHEVASGSCRWPSSTSLMPSRLSRAVDLASRHPRRSGRRSPPLRETSDSSPFPLTTGDPRPCGRADMVARHAANKVLSNAQRTARRLYRESRPRCDLHSRSSWRLAPRIAGHVAAVRLRRAFGVDLAWLICP